MVMPLHEVLQRARMDAEEGESYAASVVYWLEELEKTMPRQVRPLTERQMICRNCDHVSASFNFCCINEVNPINIASMRKIPKKCPYNLELTIIKEK